MMFIIVDIMSDVGWMFQKRANEPTTESPEGKRTCLVSQTGEKTQDRITPYIKTLFVNLEYLCVLACAWDQKAEKNLTHS